MMIEKDSNILNCKGVTPIKVQKMYKNTRYLHLCNK